MGIWLRNWRPGARVSAKCASQKAGVEWQLVWALLQVSGWRLRLESTLL